MRDHGRTRSLVTLPTRPRVGVRWPKRQEALGGIDAVVYCPGIGILRRIEDLDLAAWRKTFDTNVAGAALFTAAALPYLVESGGVAAYLSTVSVSFTRQTRG